MTWMVFGKIHWFKQKVLIHVTICVFFFNFHLVDENIWNNYFVLIYFRFLRQQPRMDVIKGCSRYSSRYCWVPILWKVSIGTSIFNWYVICKLNTVYFLTSPACFYLNPNNFSFFNSNLLYMRNLQGQVKKHRTLL